MSINAEWWLGEAHPAQPGPRSVQALKRGLFVSFLSLSSLPGPLGSRHRSWEWLSQDGLAYCPRGHSCWVYTWQTPRRLAVSSVQAGCLPASQPDLGSFWCPVSPCGSACHTLCPWSSLVTLWPPHRSQSNSHQRYPSTPSAVLSFPPRGTWNLLDAKSKPSLCLTVLGTDFI